MRVNALRSHGLENHSTGLENNPNDSHFSFLNLAEEVKSRRSLPPKGAGETAAGFVTDARSRRTRLHSRTPNWIPRQRVHRVTEVINQAPEEKYSSEAEGIIGTGVTSFPPITSNSRVKSSCHN